MCTLVIIVVTLQNEIKDNWIEDIDWAKVKETEKSSKAADFKKPLDLPETIDVTATYKAMLRLMQPGETVARAMKRLGGKNTGSVSAASVQRRQAWKDKKARQMDTGLTGAELLGDTVADASGSKSDLLELIGCADKLLSLNGEMGIYQDTFEKLSFKVKSTSETEAASRPVDEGLDMFADDAVVKPAPAAGILPSAAGSLHSGNCFSLYLRNCLLILPTICCVCITLFLSMSKKLFVNCWSGLAYNGIFG